MIEIAFLTSFAIAFWCSPDAVLAQASFRTYGRQCLLGDRTPNNLYPDCVSDIFDGLLILTEC
ncbi:hypothetical protein [Scytonema sp. HK-05]|uniref:hypothetical protein n=1 Tax=Scytonema sp. HK-05 TaxID=1137095 RepID=UPI001161442C|nr:hypothetical protein [Scytonema sp. HK-05]